MNSAMQSEMEFAGLLLTDAETWDKVLTGVPIAEGVETRKAILLFNVFMIDTESRFHQFNSGFLDAQAWNGRRGTLPDVVRLPAFKVWRHSFGGMSHSADFLALLDALGAELFDEEAH